MLLRHNLTGAVVEGWIDDDGPDLVVRLATGDVIDSDDPVTWTIVRSDEYERGQLTLAGYFMFVSAAEDQEGA